MKKIFLFVLVLGVICLSFFSLNSANKPKPQIKPIVPTPTIIQTPINNTILFVPYWTLQSGISNAYSEYIYFGVVPNSSGIQTHESGYQNIPFFVRSVPKNAKKLLGIRMIDNTINETVLQDSLSQQKIIDDTERIARDNGFDGIVLDLEYSAFPFDSVIQSVTTFSKRFGDATKSQHLLFYQTIYGDLYYRGRPYAIKDLVKNADRIIVMAYDFHKANGDPGANFPLNLGNEEYSFKDMIANFSKEVPLPKITITFGMFGYDWKVDDKGRSIGQADSLSLSDITQKFLTNCRFAHCTKSTDPESLETHVEYTDASGRSHVVWFEDMQSVKKKEDFLQKSGISSVAFWANSYF